MLVLSRKAGQEIVIGDDVTVVVHRVAGNRVTIGIEAPDRLRIVRGELDPIGGAYNNRPARAVHAKLLRTDDGGQSQRSPTFPPRNAR